MAVNEKEVRRIIEEVKNKKLLVNISPIMMLYKNTQAKEFFDVLAEVLLGDTLAPFLFILTLDYILRTSVDKIKESD